MFAAELQTNYKNKFLMGQIFSITEAAGIALHSMVLIAKSEKGLSSQQITEKTDSARHHVAKVLQRLAKHGFLYSRTGPSGGYYLKADPKTVTLLDLYETMEGPVVPQACALNHKFCAFEACLINNVSKTITTQVRDFLKSRTLDSYLV